MNKLPKSIFFVHQLPHPAHKVWAKKVNAKFIYFKGYKKLREKNNWNFLLKFFRASLPWKLPRLIISEGGAPLYTSVVYHNFSGAPIIMILADETGLRIRDYDDGYSRDIKAFLQLVDGAISVSDLTTNTFKGFLREDIPIEIVRPSVGNIFINTELKKLHSKPFKIALAVKGGKRGLMGKIPVWFNEFTERITAKEKDIKIYIAGVSNININNKNVLPLGVIPYNKMPAFYQSLNLLLHIPSFDPCPVAPVEAVASGCPVLLTKGAGTYEFFEENDLSHMIIDSTDPVIWSEKVFNILSSPPDDKQRIQYRKLIRDNLSPEISANNFKLALEKICSKIK